jgi:hypothetical protein
LQEPRRLISAKQLSPRLQHAVSIVVEPGALH